MLGLVLGGVMERTPVLIWSLASVCID